MADSRVYRDLQDLRYLKWSHARNSSGTAGTFLKSEAVIGGKKRYYKLSNFDPEAGVVGHECVNELIVDRLLNLLQVPHIHYDLIHALIEVEGREYETYLCCSEDFKERGESKMPLDNFFGENARKGESHYEFCERMGWHEFIDQMLAVDYLILNRDRHGANIEVLRKAREKSIRLAPLFDHGLSLVYSCASEEEVRKFDVKADKSCQNYIGSRSCYENLALIRDKRSVFPGALREEDRKELLRDLEEVLPKVYLDKIWKMIFTRYQIYETL